MRVRREPPAAKEPRAVARSVVRRRTTLALVGLACALFGFWARPALARYEEAHVVGDEARVTVDAGGIARIEHNLTWRVVAGQPHGFDLVGAEPSAAPVPEVVLESDEGQHLVGLLTSLPGRGLHVAVTEPKALRHGETYRVRLAYDVSLADAGELDRDGGSFRIHWRSPPPTEGYDGAKVTFLLPPTLEPPSAVFGEQGMRDDGVTATLRRAPDHDEIELVRPHVGHGEEVLWIVRVSAKAFDGASTPALPRARLLPTIERRSALDPRASVVALLLSVIFVWTLRWSQRPRSTRAQHRSGASGLLLRGRWERIAAGGAAFFVGVSLQLAESTLAGTACIALAMLCTVERVVPSAPPVRGPGQWLALRPVEVFAESTSGRPGRAARLVAFVVVPLAILAAWFVAGTLLVPLHPDALRWLGLDALAFLPLLAKDRRDGRPLAGADLGRLYWRLRKVRGLRVSPWARVPTGAVAPDEVRILAVPRSPIPGLVGIEVGRAVPGGAPEVFVRVQEASPASSKVSGLAAAVVPVPGRKSEERVYCLLPRAPTFESAARLVERLARELVDRRQEGSVWDYEERRTPRLRPQPLAAPVAG